MATMVGNRVRRVTGRIRTAARTTPSPAGERPLLFWATVVGALLLPAGIAVIVMGWYGAAHTPYGFEQTPYLISGGLLGIGLVLTGGFLYFGTWLVRIANGNQATADRLAQLISRLDGEQPNGNDGLGTGLVAGRPNAAQPSAAGGSLVATPTGTMLHRPDCPVVAGRENLRVVTGDEAGLKPCRLCNPLDAD